MLWPYSVSWPPSRQESLAYQDVSEDAGPHGLCVSSTAAGPASYVAPSALAETEGSIIYLASRTPAYQGEPGLRGSPGPLEMSSVGGTGRALGNGLQEEGGLDRCIQHGLHPTHQLPGNAGSVSSPSYLLTRPKGAPRSGPFRQHDRGSLHKSPRRALLEVPLRSSGASLGIVSAQPVFAESNACARQTESGCRHAITEQRPLRGMDAPPTGGSGDLGDIWQGRGRPLRLKRQLSLPDLLFEGHERVGPQLAQPPPLRFFSNRSDPAGHQVNQGTQTQFS